MAGQLAGLVLLGQFQALLYLAVGLAAGAHFEAGIPGYFVLAALVSIISVGFGGIGLIMAIRTGSGEAVQGMFPIMFVLLFFSSMTLPRNLIEQDWYRYLATINPVSYLIEAIRSLFVVGWDGEALALGFGFAIVIAFASITIAAQLPQGKDAELMIVLLLRTRLGRRLALPPQPLHEARGLHPRPDLPAVLPRRVRRRALVDR